MALRIGLLCCCMIWSIHSLAQQEGLSLAAGVEFGWWLHSLATTDSGAFTERGVAKTHHTGTLFLSAAWLWKIKKWRVGPTLQGSLFLEDDMRGPFDSRRRAQRILIAKEDGFIPFVHYGLHLEYHLLKRGAYTLAPAFRYGSFRFSTTHPDRQNFGYRHFGELIFQHLWHRKKRDISLRMNYKIQRVFLKQAQLPGEKHHFYSWGLSVGLRF